MPAPLALLLVTVALFGAAWALFLPPWHAPDEIAHFAYAQELAEDLERPRPAEGRSRSTELEVAANAANYEQTAAMPYTRPEWSRAAYRRWQALDAGLPAQAREDGGGPNFAGYNPPGYYAYAAVAYRLGSGGDLYVRLLLMRLASVLLLLVTVIATWLLAGEVFGRDRILQLAAAGVAGLQPMMTFLGGSVSPDPLLFATWSLALWLGVRILVHGLMPSSGAALAAVAAVAVLAKTTSYALLPGVAFVLGLGLWRARSRLSRRTIIVGSAACAAGVAAAGVLALRTLGEVAPVGADGVGPAVNPREFLSYVWQFYLPRLPFQTDAPVIGGSPLYDSWVKTGWGVFGLLDVRFPDPAYRVFAGISALALGGALVATLRGVRTIRPPVAAFIALVVLSLLAGLHWTEYRTILDFAKPFSQGRYLLPLIAVGGLAVAKGITLLSARARPVAVALVLGALVVTQLFSLGLVAGRFYA